jgi:hypothetical protein
MFKPDKICQCIYTLGTFEVQKSSDDIDQLLHLVASNWILTTHLFELYICKLRGKV